MRRLRAKILSNGPLTPKEAEVLRLLCEGYYRPEIAEKLHRAVSTVSTHIDHIADKLQARGSTEIVFIAQQMGLVEVRLIHRISPEMLLIWYLAMTQIVGFAPRRPPRSPQHAIRAVRIREIA